MASPPPALNQGAGYGIVLGLGFAFAIGMIAVTYILKRYNREVQTSEMFSTAGRTVKTGLIGSAVVSSWTWAATLLQSTSICYRYGVSGPFWYASGATVQILLFATLAIELKRRAPNGHTFLEIIRARYGKATHITFIVFGLITNILVSLMLWVGGAAVVNALTGMNTIAAIFLIPVGVVMYTVVGGLKATILTDFIHTMMMLIIIILFGFTVYASSDILGSPGKVYDLLVEVGKQHPVDGNEQGSYLTMRSKDGIIFFVINIVGNFGTVFLDNGYWNKAIAASPAHALPGYILGGISWFAIPWLTATAMGLAGLALERYPSFPTYPDRMSDADVSAGLVLPYTSVALLGKGGAVATMIMVFMAVTSAASSELIAVSSIFTYDVYRTYFRPDAPGKSLIWMSHIVVVAYAIFISCFSIGLWYGGISLGWLYVFMGVVISSAVLPAALTMLWDGQNWQAATFSPIIGTCASLGAWIGTAYKQSGELTVASLGANNPMLAGNVVALLSPVVLVPIFTFAFGSQHYDWQSMLDIRKADDHDSVDSDQENAVESRVEIERGQEELVRAGKIARYSTLFMTIAMLVVWPIPIYASGYIFSKPFFTGWVCVGLLWILLSFCAVSIYPIWEGRGTLIGVTKAMFSGKIAKAGQPIIAARSSDEDSQEKGGAKEQVIVS